mgnify:CR=1 FL=1
MKRIKFPLKVVNGKTEKLLEKGQWKMEHFFMNQGYYTLIFDNRKQMKLVKDTSINKCSGGENLSEEKEGETIHLQPHKRTVDARGGEHGGDVSEQQCLIPQLLSEIRYRLDLSRHTI